MSALPALWDHEVDVEVLGALSAIYACLTPAERSQLVKAILEGPRLEKADSAQFRKESIEYEIYLRLEGLGEDARKEHPLAGERYTAILGAHSSWIGSFEKRLARREPQVSTKSLVKTVEPETDPQTLVEQILSRGAPGADEFYSLAGLSMEERAEAIRYASTRVGGDKALRVLFSIGKNELADESSFTALLDMLVELPVVAISASHREVASLLDMIAEHLGPESAKFFAVWDLVSPSSLREPLEILTDGPPDYLTSALNSSSGLATHALLKFLGKTELQHDAGIAGSFRDRLESIISSSEPGGFYGRVIIASRLHLLSWLDLGWTVANLTPLLSWDDPVEAAGAWQGYLWSPRMDGSLFEAVRDDFVEAFSHVEELRNMTESLCGLLVSLVLDAPGKLTAQESKKCLRVMGAASRQRVAWLFAKRLEATDENKRPDLWRDRIDAWIAQNWPVEAEFADGDVSERLAWAATFAGAAFPEAVRTILPHITSTCESLLTISALRELGLCDRFPKECLMLLDRLVGQCTDGNYLAGLGPILRAIRVSQPKLASTLEFCRLHEVAQAAGEVP